MIGGRRISILISIGLRHFCEGCVSPVRCEVEVSRTCVEYPAVFVLSTGRVLSGGPPDGEDGGGDAAENDSSFCRHAEQFMPSFSSVAAMWGHGVGAGWIVASSRVRRSSRAPVMARSPRRVGSVMSRP